MRLEGFSRLLLTGSDDKLLQRINATTMCVEKYEGISIDAMSPECNDYGCIV